MAFVYGPGSYASVVLNDNMSGTPDNWTDWNGATHSFASGEMTVIDDSVIASEAVILTNALSFAQDTVLIQMRWKITGVGGTGQYIGVYQMVDSMAGGNMWMYLLYDVTNGKFAASNGGGITLLNTTVSVDTYYDVEITVNTTTGLFNVYINGVLDTANIAKITGASNTYFARSVIGGGSTPRTWTAIVDSLLIKQGYCAGNFFQFF